MARLLKIAAVVLVAGAVAVAAMLVVRNRHDRSQAVAPGSTAASATTVEIVPGPGQSLVMGTLASLSADQAVGPALRPPFTVTIGKRGQGHADITGVTSGGRAVQVFWYGGQPLPVSGTGTLGLDGAPVTVDATGITWSLDGAPRSLTTGHFTLGAPVAEGASGLARFHDSFSFDAGNRSTMETAGGARVHLAAAAVHLDGPGRLELHGRMELKTASGTRAVRTVAFGPGSYSVDLVPVADGYTIRSTLQGPVSFS